MRHQIASLFIFMSCVWAMPAQASDELLSLALEDLLKIEISSASRKVQQVQDVAAAVFVISHDEIERSGARSIPEALRLAPGVEVARIGNNRWAVSIRGFNGRFANKLLVLKDGRSIYSPLFSGVMWEAQDAMLGDIERIEVIRGPSAAMWGSNAVNGVINIISRSAADTLGTQLIASSATDEAASLTLSHGFELGDAQWRVSAKSFDLSPAKTASGTSGNDGWRSSRVGLRGDWAGSGGSRWRMVGEAWHSRADDRLDFTRYSVVPPLIDISQSNAGSNVMLRREQPTADGGQLDWQISAESTDLNLQSLIHEVRHTVAAEFQQRSNRGAHELLWGASYRLSRDHLDLANGDVLGSSTFTESQRDWRVASIFLHDDFVLIPDRLRLSGGLRVDWDSWSGTQAQPDIRLAWMPNATTTAWGSLSRAARTQSRLELDIPFKFSETAPNPPYVPGVVVARMPPPPGTLKAEIVTALEAGFRQRLNAQLSVDVSAFVSDYASMVSLVTQPAQVISPTLVLVPLTNINGASARTHGFELATDWQVSSHWRLQANYSRLYLSSPRLADPAAAAAQDLWEGRVPRHRASLRSSWTRGNGDQIDLWLKHTSALANPSVPGYTGLDLRYAWRVGPGFELAITGQNLLDQRHPEFVSDYLPIEQTEIGRSLLVKGIWRF